jgi:hypothetical protein
MGMMSLMEQLMMVTLYTDVSSSDESTHIVQTPHLPSVRAVMNAPLEQIGSARQYVQTTLLNLWSSQMPGPG